MLELGNGPTEETVRAYMETAVEGCGGDGKVLAENFTQIAEEVRSLRRGGRMSGRSANRSLRLIYELLTVLPPAP